MGWPRGFALLIPGIVFFVTVMLVNSFMNEAVKIVLLLLPTVIVLAGITLVYAGKNKPST